MSDYYLSRGDARFIFHREHVTDHGAKPVPDTFVPVAVIPFEDREVVERLVKHDGFLGEYATGGDVSDMQAALREFAAPAPAKPEEPTGLGAVVEDAAGVRWVRAGLSHDGRLTDNWRSTHAGDDSGWWASWRNIEAVRKLSDGVPE